MKNYLFALFVTLAFFMTQKCEAKIYSFPVGDALIIYSDKDLTEVTITRNRRVLMKDGTLSASQYAVVGVWFSDTIRVDAQEWNGFWVRIPSIDSDAGFNWVISGLQNDKRAKKIAKNRRPHPLFTPTSPNAQPVGTYVPNHSEIPESRIRSIIPDFGYGKVL